MAGAHHWGPGVAANRILSDRSGLLSFFKKHDLNSNPYTSSVLVSPENTGLSLQAGQEPPSKGSWVPGSSSPPGAFKPVYPCDHEF